MAMTRATWIWRAAGAVLPVVALVLLGGVLAPRQAMAGDGGTLRVTGTPQVVEPAHDPQFNVSADTTRLVRQVEMFQWREVGAGAGRHYAMDWVDHPVDATRFAQPQGHANPGAFPFDGKQFFAPAVRLGDYTLDAAIVRGLPGAGSIIHADLSHLPANLAATFQVVDGTLVTSAQPDAPRLGDLRVRWKAVPLQPVTVVARADGDTLVATTAAGAEPERAPPSGSAWMWRLLALLAVVLLGGALLAVRRRTGRRGRGTTGR